MADTLDLHSLAVLINYERTSGPVSDPRFRHTRLREIASPDGKFNTILLPRDIWPGLADSHPKRGFVLDTEHIPSDEHDTPANMLSSRAQQSLSELSDHELESIYYQIRGHDACFQTIAIFQELAGMYEPSQELRVRLRDGTDFTTAISTRVILEFTFQAPKQTTLSIVIPPVYIGSRPQVEMQFRYTGEEREMIHSVWGFARPGEENVSVVLDLASMQFGTAGRGLSGDFFVLDTMDGWYDFVEKIVRGCEPLRSSFRIRPSGDPEKDEWFKKVAARVKERWDARETSRWCGLCGKPDATKRCGRCKQEYYCSDAHSKAAWKSWHKKWCTVA